MLDKIKVVGKIAWLVIILIGSVLLYIFVRSISRTESDSVRRAKLDIDKLKRDIDDAQRFLNNNPPMRPR